MEPKNNVVVHAGVSNNLYPQGPTFHWRDGWMFARGEGMTVHIWNTHLEIKIPDGEWDSIVGFLSYPKAPPTPPNLILDNERLRSALTIIHDITQDTNLNVPCWQHLQNIAATASTALGG
jgi:hypothetical protein